ncbi:MAG: hypothetical protein ACETVM_04460 [Candidatus Bathyarchaeia archaeon]
MSKRMDISGVSLRGRCNMCLHQLITRHTKDARVAMEICELLKSREQCPYYLNMERKSTDTLTFYCMSRLSHTRLQRFLKFARLRTSAPTKLQSLQWKTQMSSL